MKKYDWVDTGKRVHDVLCGEKSWKYHPEHELKPGEICPTCTLGLRVMTPVEAKSEAAIDKHQTPVTYLEHEQDNSISNGSNKWQRTTLTASTVTNGRTE